MSATAQVSVRSAGGVTAADDTDDGACTWEHCSFREAINEANADPDPDTIFLSPAAAAAGPALAAGPARSEGPARTTSVLTGPLPPITTDLTIIGEGSAMSIIDADGSVANMRRGLDINGNIAVTLEGLTLQGGVSGGNGGGILVAGGASLATEDVAVVDNETHSAEGGGIAITGAGSTARLENTEVSNNRTFGENWPGGGISVLAGASLYVGNGWIKNNVVNEGWGGGIRGLDFDVIEIVDTEVENNSVLVGFGGGGIFAEAPGLPATGPGSPARQAGAGGMLIVGGSMIDGNNAAGWGGGARIEENVTAHVSNSTISGNTADQAGGAVELGNNATLTADNTNFDNNFATTVGGALALFGHSSATITGGSANGNSSGIHGGAVYMQEVTQVTSDGTTFDDNQTANGGGGAYVTDYAKLIVSNGSISNNTGAFGGGAYMLSMAPAGAPSFGSPIGGTPLRVAAPVSPTPFGAVVARQAPTPAEITVINSTVANNQATVFSAGGICAQGGTLTIMGSMIMNNQAADSGGGVYSDFGAVVNVTSSEITSNSAGGAGGGFWLDPGTAVLDQLSVSGNTSGAGGGGMLTTQNVTLSNSTVSGNTAVLTGGGVIGGTTGPFTVHNSTISGNTADDGGGLFVGFGPATLTNVTITGNSATTQGGGASVYPTGVVTFTNTLFAANQGPAGDENCTVVGAGSLSSGGGNLADDATCAGLTMPTDQTDTPAGLDPNLADNGGPTLTHALLSGSRAIDAGVDVGETTDQRGFDLVGADDTGSFESTEPQPNRDPVADIVANPASVQAGDNNQTVVTIDGSGSSDPDGDMLTFQWTVQSGTFVNGTTSTDSVIQVTFPGNGAYGVTLIVSDGRGGSDSTNLVIPLS